MFMEVITLVQNRFVEEYTDKKNPWIMDELKIPVDNFTSFTPG